MLKMFRIWALRKGSIKKQFCCTKGNETCALSKGRVKKNQREIPLRRGVSDGRFSPKKKNLRSMVLKHWILHNNHFKTHLFFKIFGWGDPFQLRSDPGPKGGSNLKALWRSHLTSVRGPISYRIRFMAHRSFFFSFFNFFPGQALSGNSPFFF